MTCVRRTSAPSTGSCSALGGIGHQRGSQSITWFRRAHAEIPGSGRPTISSSSQCEFTTVIRTGSWSPPPATEASQRLAAPTRFSSSWVSSFHSSKSSRIVPASVWPSPGGVAALGRSRSSPRHERATPPAAARHLFSRSGAGQQPRHVRHGLRRRCPLERREGQQGHRRQRVWFRIRRSSTFPWSLQISTRVSGGLPPPPPPGRRRRTSPATTRPAPCPCACPASSARKCSKSVKSIPSAVRQKISAASSGVRSGTSSPRARPRAPVTSWASASPARS